MKKHRLTFILMLITGVSAICQPDIEHLVKQKFQWLVDKKVDSLRNILDDQLKYIHSNGWIQTKDDVLSDLVTGKLTYESIVVAEVDVRRFDNTAIATGKGKFKGIASTTPFTVDLLFTEVYVMKGKQWKLVSRHANKMP